MRRRSVWRGQFCATKHSIEGIQGQLCENESRGGGGGRGRSVTLSNAVIFIPRADLSRGLKQDYNSRPIIT